METTLFYKDDRSDKVYQAGVYPEGDGHIVRFAFGRRGGPLTPGRKTTSPVTLSEAEKIFGKLIAEKRAKGYAEAVGNIPALSESAEAPVAPDARDTGFIPPM